MDSGREYIVSTQSCYVIADPRYATLNIKIDNRAELCQSRNNTWSLTYMVLVFQMII